MSYETSVELTVSGIDLYNYKVKVDPSECLELQYTEYVGDQENTVVIGFSDYAEMERVANAMLKACAIAKEMNS
jgi:hypothetical protein